MRKNFRKNFSNISNPLNLDSNKNNNTTISRKNINNNITTTTNPYNIGNTNINNLSNKISDFSGFSENTKSINRTNNANNNYAARTEKRNLKLSNTTTNNNFILNTNKNELDLSNLITISNLNFTDKKQFENVGKNSEIKTRKIKIRNSTAIKHSYKFEQEYLISIIENFAREVGISALNTRTNEIFITQFIDNEAYVNSLALINYWNPLEIVMNQKTENSCLHLILKKYFKKCFIAFSPRKNFNEEFGKQKYLNSLIRELSLEDINNKYVCMASLSGLIHYIENISNLNLSSESLIISYHYLENHLNIPYHSTVELELLNNRKFNTLEESLISLFDTKTLSGARLLRSNFLQPPAIKSEICLRQISVSELFENRETLYLIREQLKNFKELEIFIAKFSLRISDPTENNVRQILFAINGLREALKHLQQFAEALRAKLVTEYFLIMLKCFEDSALMNILTRIDEFLDDIDLQNVKIAKKQDLILFMVKPGIDNVLDVSRKVYSDTIEEIYAEFDRIKEASNDPHIKLLFNEAKGFYVTVNENFYCERDFDVAKKEGKKYNCANIALLSYSQRIKEIKKDIIDISFKIVFDVYEMIQKNLSYIHIASSHIALLDVLCSFAFYAINTKIITKPVIMDNDEPWVFSPEKSESSDSNANNNNFNLNNSNFQDSRLSSIFNSNLKSNNSNNLNYINKYPLGGAQAPPKAYLIGRKCFHPVLEKGNIILNVYNTNEDSNFISSYNNKRKKGGGFSAGDQPKKFIPNDYYISDLFNFIVIRGANASGKTTYMKQLALLVILAQCGCFVPCEFFKFSLRKYLFTKFDCSDSIEDNKGSFVRTILEIQKMITSNVCYPLFLLDEPFDNSEHLENLCITLSVIDKINAIRNTPFLVVSSHNSNLNLLSSLYTNIIIGNMEVEFKKNSLNFLYKFEFTNPLECLKNNDKKNDKDNYNRINNQEFVDKGNSVLMDSGIKEDLESEKAQEAKKFCSENYGIILADMLGFPKEMINNALSLAENKNDNNMISRVYYSENYLLYKICLFRIEYMCLNYEIHYALNKTVEEMEDLKNQENIYMNFVKNLLK